MADARMPEEFYELARPNERLTIRRISRKESPRPQQKPVVTQDGRRPALVQQQLPFKERVLARTQSVQGPSGPGGAAQTAAAVAPDWRQGDRGQLRPQDPLSGPLKLEVLFLMPRPARLRWKKRAMPRCWHASKPDLDNLVKAGKDSLKEILWHDDSQVAELAASKMHCSGQEAPGVTVVLERLAGDTDSDANSKP
jgi:Holliday junction resolvase RusA-like endonuclease